MRTYRRLNDPTRYYNLSWRGWLACGLGAAVLYGAARISPFGVKPTITLVLFVLTGAGMTLYALSGQALGVGRYLAAIVRWRTGHKQYRPPSSDGSPDRGVLVDAVPAALLDGRESGERWEDPWTAATPR